MTFTSRALTAAVLLCLAQSSFSADAPADVDDVDDAPKRAVVPRDAPPDLADFCFVPSAPTAGIYKVIRRVKLGKGSYGTIRDILPAFAQQAKSLGADAVIEYDGAQRFGLFPWRIVRPVVHGVAVKWTQPQAVSCAALGGSTLQAIMATDKAPPRAAAASAPAP